MSVEDALAKGVLLVPGADLFEPIRPGALGHGDVPPVATGSGDFAGVNDGVDVARLRLDDSGLRLGDTGGLFDMGTPGIRPPWS